MRKRTLRERCEAKENKTGNVWEATIIRKHDRVMLFREIQVTTKKNTFYRSYTKRLTVEEFEVAFVNCCRQLVGWDVAVEKEHQPVPGAFVAFF